MKKRYSNSLFHNIVSNFLFEVVKSSYLSKKKSYEGAYTRWGSLWLDVFFILFMSRWACIGGGAEGYKLQLTPAKSF